LGVPTQGYWAEILNTDAAVYGGDNRGNMGGCMAQEVPSDGHQQSVELVLPPLSVIVLQQKNTTAED
jgi:1,4-alpha-glucan branching enzyme